MSLSLTERAVWGGADESNAGDNTEKFATYYREGDSELDYAVNRYYNPVSGRFTTADPYRASAGVEDPGSWNRFAYVQGDPVSFADPVGLQRWFVSWTFCENFYIDREFWKQDCHTYAFSINDGLGGGGAAGKESGGGGASVRSNPILYGAYAVLDDIKENGVDCGGFINALASLGHTGNGSIAGMLSMDRLKYAAAQAANGLAFNGVGDNTPLTQIGLAGPGTVGSVFTDPNTAGLSATNGWAIYLRTGLLGDANSQPAYGKTVVLHEVLHKLWKDGITMHSDLQKASDAVWKNGDWLDNVAKHCF